VLEIEDFQLAAGTLCVPATSRESFALSNDCGASKNLFDETES
jgi:hypothetical protein